MNLARSEIVFIGFGGLLGALVGLCAQAGYLGATGAFPPFVFLLLGLGIAEIAGGFVTGSPPGGLVRMPSRIAAFALGLGVLVLITGRLA